MADWRKQAFSLLPELRKKAESSEQIMSFWIEVLGTFEQAYERQPPDDDLILRIYSFADWCLAAPRHSDAAHDPSTATMVAFYEHIPTILKARDDMPRWFTPAEVARLAQIFSYHVGREIYQELLRNVRENRRAYLPRHR